MVKPTSIYAIRCNPNGRLYIGMSIQVEERIKQHMDALRLRSHNVKALQADYDTYGQETFSFFVLEEGLTDHEARQREQDFMDEYKTRNPEFGYNIKHLPFGKGKKKPQIIYAKPPLPDTATRIANALGVQLEEIVKED